MNADDEIAVKLTASQWQTMLAILAEQPFKVSAPLIQAIQKHCVQYETEAGRRGEELHSAMHAVRK